MARYTRATVPAHWTVAEAARLKGREVRPGTVLRIRGERGTFRFLRHVTLPDGRQWIDVRDASGCWRSFRPEAVRSIPRKQTAPRGTTEAVAA